METSKVRAGSTLVEGSKVSFNDVIKCYSLDKKSVFLSRLAVYIKTGGDVWINNKAIHQLLKNSTNVQIVYEKVQSEKVEFKEKIGGFRAKERSQLQKMEESLMKMERILKEVFPEKALEETIVTQSFSVGDPVAVPKELNLEKKDEIQKRFEENCDKFAGNIQASTKHEEIKMEALTEKVVDQLLYYAEAKVVQVTELKAAAPIVPLMMKLSDSKGLIGDAVSGLVEFAQKHMVASNEGHRIFEKMLPEDRQNIERLAFVDKEIGKLEIELTYHDKKSMTSSKQAVLDQIGELKLEQAALREIMAPLKKKIEADRVGNFFPIVHHNTVDAVHRHFSGLARAMSSLKNEHLAFESFPSHLKGMLISQKIKELQESGDSNVLNQPIYISSEQELQNAGIDLNVMLEVANIKYKMNELESELQDDEKMIADIERRGPTKAGWFTAEQSQEEFDEELALLKGDYLLREEALQLKRDFLLRNGPKVTEMDKGLGTLMDNGNKAEELKFLSQMTNPLIEHVLFPKGIKFGSLLDKLVKLKRVEIDEKGKELFNGLLLSYIDYYSDPAFLNRQLEPIILAQLENSKSEKKVESTPSPQVPKSLFTDEQLIDSLLEKEPPSPDPIMTQKYKDLAFNLLEVGAPSAGGALKKITDYIGDFGVAEQAHRTIETTVGAMAMGFGNKGINNMLESVGTAYALPEGKSSIPKAKTYTQEEDLKTYESVRGGIQELAKSDMVKALAAAGGGWGGWLIPGSVMGAAADYAATGAVQMYDITQIKSVNRMLMLEVISAIGNSISEVSKEVY